MTQERFIRSSLTGTENELERFKVTVGGEVKITTLVPGEMV
jgi:hypothetical protein